MKGSAITHEAQPDVESPESAFQRFAKTMRALVAVPKRELEEKIANDKAERSESRKAGR
jgi:hypothetical protein